MLVQGEGEVDGWEQKSFWSDEGREGKVLERKVRSRGRLPVLAAERRVGKVGISSWAMVHRSKFQVYSFKAKLRFSYEPV